MAVPRWQFKMFQRTALAITAAALWIGVIGAAPGGVDVRITVFACAQDSATTPILRVEDVDRQFARLPIKPAWHDVNGVWTALVHVPSGHFIVDADSAHCSGRTQQMVAIPGGERHVSITVNESKVVTTDENMYAAAIYGRIPAAGTSVELIPADSVLGDAGRRSAVVDGDTYQFGHVVPGLYYVIMQYGTVRAARLVTVPAKVYGPTVEVSMTSATALRLSQAESSGSRFHDYTDPKFGPYSMFEIGASAADGWTANPLPPAAGYPVWGKQLSSGVVRAIEIARKFIERDDALPSELRTIDAYSVSIAAYGGNDQPLFLRLIPLDTVVWARSVTLMGSPCAESPTGIALHGMGFSIDLKHNAATVITICP